MGREVCAYMKNQLFTKPVPPQVLWRFLTAVQAVECDTYYTVSNAEYKRANLVNALAPFLAEISPFYLPSKRHFINHTSTMSYIKMMTIVRQLCNANGIVYERKMKYDKSTYEIIYHINKPTPPLKPQPIALPPSLSLPDLLYPLDDL